MSIYASLLLGYEYNPTNENIGWCRSLMVFLLAALLVTVGSGISLLFIYTEIP